LNTGLASFGNVPYGHTIIGRVEIAKPFDACEDVKVTSTDNESGIPFIVLTKRGKCTFSQKAFNAQRLGASAVIVIDNKDEDPSNVIPYAEPAKGMKIHIPTILVNEEQFKDITTAVKTHSSDIASNEHEVLLTLKFPLVKKETANVSFLLDISNKKNLEMVTDIKEYLIPLLKDNTVKVDNLYDMQATKTRPQDAKKPYNCVLFGDSSICAKSSGKPLFPSNFSNFCAILTKIREKLELKFGRQCPLRNLQPNVHQ
jgi:hypothetical protein